MMSCLSFGVRQKRKRCIRSKSIGRCVGGMSRMTECFSSAKAATERAFALASTRLNSLYLYLSHSNLTSYYLMVSMQTVENRSYESQSRSTQVHQ